MQADFYYRFQSAVAKERLSPFAEPGLSDVDLACKYLWNNQLSESLYTVVQAIEVGLRNSLNGTLTYQFSSPDWYDSHLGFFDPRSQHAISEAQMTLRREGKPIEPGRMVAALGFGFWSGLLSVHYEHRSSRLWPQNIRRTFPAKPAEVYQRKHVAPHIELARKLRNRIFHHERIVHWDLKTTHATLMRTLSWISPAIHHSVLAVDRFPLVHQRGWQDCRRQLMTYSHHCEYLI